MQIQANIQNNASLDQMECKNTQISKAVDEIKPDPRIIEYGKKVDILIGLIEKAVNQGKRLDQLLAS